MVYIGSGDQESVGLVHGVVSLVSNNEMSNKFELCKNLGLQLPSLKKIVQSSC